MELLPKCIWKTVFLFLVPFGMTKQVAAQDSLVADSALRSNRTGIENLLQGNVAGLRIKSWSGAAGAQSLINLRGLSLDPSDQSAMPLILVNGVQIIGSPSNITGINPLSYYSADQVERIEVIKDIDQLAAFGVQAPNGAINIIMKEGKPGAIHIRASGFAGPNFLQDMDYRKDAFYNFNTTGRRAVYQQGTMIHEQNVTVDGAGTYGSYLFGLTNHQDNGITRGTSFGRQSLFLNARYQISKQFSAHFYNNLALTSRKGRYAGDVDRSLLLPVINDESFFMDKNRNVGLTSSIGLNYQFNPEFKLSSVAGLSYEGADRDLYVPSAVLDGNIYASSATYKRQLITLNTSANYLHDFSKKLRLDMTLGNEIRTIDNRLTSVNGSRSLESGGSDFVKVVNGYNASQINALSDREMEKLLSFYGIWKLKYAEDLVLNLVLRADGSTFYDKKWALYPAAGLNYDLKNKLRLPLSIHAAFGKTGMLSGPEVYRGQLEAYGEYYGGTELGIGTAYRAFPDAQSVSVYQADAGITVSILPSLDVSAGYFSKTYQDFTYQRFLPNISGIDYQYETGGSLGLSGLEFNLEGRWLNTPNFSWSTALNFASYRNKVKKLPAAVEETSLAYLAALSNGDALSSLVAYEGNQQKIIGNSEPKAFGGISNTLRYKNISASMTVTYSWGADVAAESFSSRYDTDVTGTTFPLKNSETPYYTTSTGAEGQTIYQGIRSIEDASFIRLNRAAITYHFGPMRNGLKSLSDLQVFVRGENLLTLSKYSGINPEENIAGIRRYDLGTTGTPLPSSVVLGLKVVF
ncbi:TonB-dependent receptor plug domain-containing protein [Pedobacter sp. AW31-3R]|uniref:TonB-dependent receptor plug domain-containing protein n=1 Tax=Pedobacter sp. AW31-3R TaxID=3445781 RepID=UPI003FA06D9F